MQDRKVRPGPSRRVVLAGAVASLSAPFLGRSALAELGPIRLGLLQSLTGATANAGAAAVLGITIALDDIKAAGGISGRPVEAFTVDDQSDTTAGVSLARKLIDDNKVHAILGPQFSQVVMAMLPLATKARIPQISGAGSSDITPQLGPYHFSMNASATLNAQEMVKLAATMSKSRRIAFLSDTGAQSKTTLEEVQKAMKSTDLTLTSTQQFQYRSSDVTPQLLSLQGNKPDLILLATSTGEDTATVARGLSELGWNVPVVGNIAIGTLAPTSLLSATKEQMANFYGLTFKSATYCSGGQPDPKYTAFIKRALAADPERTTIHSAGWYDVTMLLKHGIEGAGSTDGPAVAQWIEQNGSKVSGIYGTLSASPTNHFLFGLETITFAKAMTARPDGTAERLVC